jgi:uncharacterized protein
VSAPHTDVERRSAPAFDCDVHPVLASTKQLVPYLDDYWTDYLEQSHFPPWVPNHHPPGAAISRRPDATRDDNGECAREVGSLTADVLDRGKTDVAVLQCLYGVQSMLNPQMERALARALNMWIASIVLPMRAPEAAVAELERWADDPRFVQVLVLVQSEALYGREVHWPVWEAAERAGLPVAIHLGGMTGFAPTTVGWPSTYIEWYVGQQASFEAQVASLVCEGVFQRFPDLKVVLCEAGMRWMPAFMWRLSKLWKGQRRDVPWVDRLPSEIIRDHLRMTTSPSDGADSPGQLDELVERLGSDRMLLYASDYPHWHASEPQAIAHGTRDPALFERIRRENPAELYSPRLAYTAAKEVSIS